MEAHQELVLLNAVKVGPRVSFLRFAGETFAHLIDKWCFIKFSFLEALFQSTARPAKILGKGPINWTIMWNAFNVV